VNFSEHPFKIQTGALPRLLLLGMADIPGTYKGSPVSVYGTAARFQITAGSVVVSENLSFREGAGTYIDVKEVFEVIPDSSSLAADIFA
jgi:hypothetical protein